mgnify:FL=1|jgi:hypothetical protein
MGVGKKVATRKGKKLVENATDGIPIVGDIVDDAVKSGPMDRARGSARSAANKVKDKRDDGLLGKK